MQKSKPTPIASITFQNKVIKEVIFKKDYFNALITCKAGGLENPNPLPTPLDCKAIQTRGQYLFKNEPADFIKLLSKHYLILNIETELVEIDDVKLHKSFYYIHNEQNVEKKYMADNGIVQVTFEEMFRVIQPSNFVGIILTNCFISSPISISYTPFSL